MKYALLIYSDWDATGIPDGAREGWIEYARAAKEAGVLLGAEQLTGTDTATSVRVRGGQRLLTDGPFLETLVNQEDSLERPLLQTSIQAGVAT